MRRIFVIFACLTLMFLFGCSLEKGKEQVSKEKNIDERTNEESAEWFDYRMILKLHSKVVKEMMISQLFLKLMPKRLGMKELSFI